MIKCKTCEEIDFWKNQISDYVDYKLFAKISQYGWRKGKRKIKGNQDSAITTRAFDLKYCPTCGKRVNKHVKNKSISSSN